MKIETFAAILTLIGIIGLLGYFATKDDDPKPKAFGWFIWMAVIGLLGALSFATEVLFN